MDNTIVLYKLIEYIKTKNSHGKNELLDFIVNCQTQLVINDYNSRELERKAYINNIIKEGK